ncbi:hypothetical protein PVAP13_4NG209522 [Panicum virgatum]|uniref:Uncharacterized protein n=1 Tax=Panicum virgatum TaxID=38727 RepID=A0A8T0TEA2_PANVG|nr:hypothetical protein PVAP13_4NG209522 [Panicum virgatum]
MNKCLLSKWIFKIERGDGNICCNLLRKKYLGTKRLHGNQDCCERGLRYVIVNGKKVRFWHDVWIGECPLRQTHLYQINNQQEGCVHEVLGSGEVELTFRRNFGEREILEWEALLDMVGDTLLTQESDAVKWIFEKLGVFSTTSLYKEVTFPGMTNKWMLLVWEAKLLMASLQR